MKEKATKQIKNKIVEAIEDSLFDTGISADELRIRKHSTARVLKKAQQALEVAEEAGKTDIVSQLQSKIDKLQDWLDHADDIDTSEPDKVDKPDISDKGDGRGEDKKVDADEEEGGVDTDSDSETHSDRGGGGDKEKKGSKDDPGEDGKEQREKPEEDPEKTSIDGPDKKPGDEPKKDPTDGPKKDHRDGPKKGPEEDPDEGPGGDPGTEPEETSEEDDDLDDDDGDGEGDGEDGDAEEDGEGGDGDEDSGKIDPFKRRMPGQPPKESKKEPKERESVFDAAKRILSKLDGEARRGAVDGLKDLLTNRGAMFEESYKTHKLTEAITKTLGQLTEEEFHDELAEIMSIVDSVIEIDYSHDLEKRVAEIKRDASSKLSKLDLEKEDQEHVKADEDPVQASETEREKYKKVAGIAGLEEFEYTLYNAIADQVEESEDSVDSWSAIDRRHEDDPSIIVPGKVLDDEVDHEIPTLNVYFDQSGSWSDSDVRTGMRAISVINEFHERGEIKLNVFYMSAGGIFTTAAAARVHGEAEGWHAALQHIKGSKVKNVVVLSDYHLDHPGLEWNNRPTGDNGTTVVDGCVWWLWKNGSTCTKAVKELIGLSGNFEYKFTV
jgi:hypothetical protein